MKIFTFTVLRTFESNGLLDDPVVRKIAESKGKTAAQVLLKFLNQEGIVVIPKSVSPARVLENIQVKKHFLTTNYYIFSKYVQCIYTGWKIVLNDIIALCRYPTLSCQQKS